MKEEFNILYKDFLKILLDYQIKSRDKYLRNFVSLFKSVDLDNNGIINEEEFVALVQSFNIYENIEEEALRLLNQVDPYNNKHITFSECVTLFSIETIPQNNQNEDEEEVEGTQNISVLDKICMQGISS